MSEQTSVFLLRDRAIRPKYGFLLEAYKPQYYYWETCENVRKLALVGLVMLADQGSAEQIACAAALCMLFLGLQINYAPYKTQHDNCFRLVTEVPVLMALLLAVVLHSHDAGEDANVSEATLDWALIISIIICIPVSLVTTIIMKFRDAKQLMIQTGKAAAIKRFQLGMDTKADREMIDEMCEKASCKRVVMSSPEWGTLDKDNGVKRLAEGAEPKEVFNQRVMDKVSELQQIGYLKLGFDRAGTSTAREKDNSKFEEAFALRDEGKHDEAVALLKSTDWWYGYQTSVKQAVKIESQGYDGVLDVICIQGGFITALEAAEMERIMIEAQSDCEKSGIKVLYTVCEVSYYEFLSEYEQVGAGELVIPSDEPQPSADAPGAKPGAASRHHTSPAAAAAAAPSPPPRPRERSSMSTANPLTTFEIEEGNENPVAQPRAISIFAQVDTDGNGTVSYDEFARWWGRKQLALTGVLDESKISELKHQWDVFDVDKSGNLDPQEFSAVLTAASKTGWEEMVDPHTGRYYYYHKQTQETKWERPDSSSALERFLQEQGVVPVGTQPLLEI
jgi:hypothetical protein